MAKSRSCGNAARGFSILEVLVVVGLLAMLLALLSAAVFRARGSMRALTCASNLRNIGIAIENYAGAHGNYPFGIALDQSAWMRILPFLGENALYEKLLAEPFSIRNAGTASRINIATFLCPERADQSVAGNAPAPVPIGLAGQDLSDGGHCNYAPCGGIMVRTDGSDGPRPGAGVYWRFGGGTTRPSQVADGLSKTMMTAEIASGAIANRQSNPEGIGLVFLAYAGSDDLSATSAACVSAQAAADDDAFRIATSDRWADAVSFGCLMPPGGYGCNLHLNPRGWGLGDAQPAGVLHDGIVNAVFCDGSVHPLSKNIDLAVWRALGTMAGGEANASP